MVFTKNNKIKKTGLTGVEEDTGCAGKLPENYSVQFTLVWMDCSLSKVSLDSPLCQECLSLWQIMAVL